MADNYVLFSSSLKVDRHERSWIMDKIHYFENPPDPNGPEWESFSAECERYEVDAERSTGLDLQVEFSPEEVIFYSDGYGNWFHAAKLVQDLFRKLRNDACWNIEWAETCSKARPGEFGGGAAFVTVENIKSLHSQEWLRAQVDAWSKEEADG